MLAVPMRRYSNKRKLEIETQLASSMLYYDIEEFEKFMDLWIKIEDNPDFETSGMFSSFINGLRKIMRPEHSDKISKEFVLSRLRQLNNFEENKSKAELFNAWLDDISEDDTSVEFHLGDELFYMYSWEIFKESVLSIDRQDVPFKEKILVEPIRVDYTERDQIFSKAIDFVFDESNLDNSITTGFNALDRYVKPQLSNFMVIAARPSVGKSTFMLRMLYENAKKGIKGLFISLEMNEKQVYSKLYSWYKGREVDPSEHESIKKEEEFIRINNNITFVINYTNNGDAILDIMRRSVKRDKKKVVYIDYLQLIRFKDKNEFESLREATFSFKSFANSNKILVVSSTQVSRSSENYGIDLSSLFGSSTIENDSDIIIAMEKRDRETMHSHIKAGSMSILKNRDGERDVTIGTMMDYIKIEFSESS